MNAILRSIDVNGAVGFWTGRAGEAWVSADRAEAFAALSLEAARRKALQFNRMAALHGQHFVAVSAEVEADWTAAHA